MTRIVERLDYSSGVSEDGDVVPLADIDTDQNPPMLDEYRIARMHPHSEDLPDMIDTIRQAADFTQRNEALAGMASKIAEANRHDGAAQQLASLKYVRHYRGVEHAMELHAVAARRTRELGAEACAACPLVDFCNTNSLEVIHTLGVDRKIRNRFKNRLENHPDNDHFCQTNMSAGKQKDSIA